MTEEQFHKLYEKTGALVLRRCQIILKNQAEAEDTLQEVFVRVLKYAGRFENGEVDLPWLYRVAVNCSLSRLKKRRREPSSEAAEPQDIAGTSNVGGEVEAKQIVMQFLDRLDGKLLEVALLHYVDGISQEAIAEQLNLSRRTVGKRIGKLREKAAHFRKHSKF